MSAQPPPATRIFREPLRHVIVASASSAAHDVVDVGSGEGSGVGEGVGAIVGDGVGSGVAGTQSGAVGACFPCQPEDATNRLQ